MFTCNLMFVIFGLFLLSFCDTTLSKCNDTNPCACIVPDNEAERLTNLLYGRSLGAKELYKFSVDLCTVETDKISESVTINKDNKNGLVCAITLHGPENPLSLHVVNQSIVNTETEYKNISVTVVSEKLIIQTYVNCCKSCDAQSTPDVDHPTIYHVSSLQATDIHKQLSSNGLSTGSTLVILLFVFSGIYFIGGAILLKLLRGATGWEVLPNHEFWCDLPSLIRDGITFTFNCGRVDTYQSI